MQTLTIQEARSRPELLANLIQKKSHQVLASHFVSLQDSISTIKSIDIFSELSNPLSGRLRDRIDTLVKRGSSAYEMDVFRQIIMIDHEVSRGEIAKIFGVDESTVSKLFTECNIDFHRKRVLFKKFNEILSGKWIPLSDENIIYAFAWALSKFRKEILKKIPKNEINQSSPLAKRLAPSDCVYLRCMLENQKWCRCSVKTNSKDLQAALEEINHEAREKYGRLLVNPDKQDELVEPLTHRRAIEILMEWQNTFEVFAYSLSDYLFE